MHGIKLSLWHEDSYNHAMNLEKFFGNFRKEIVGVEQTFTTPFGEKKILYADWTASGRLYNEIENKIHNQFGPFLGNTHSESSMTGSCMTHAYGLSHKIIKEHVGAGPEDVIITEGFGMTGCIVRFQRILGLKISERWRDKVLDPNEKKPVVFVSHMEHHSNQTSWLETIADVVVLPPCDEGLICLDNLRNTVKDYTDRPLIIGAFSACSNVTGIETPIHEMAEIMHEFGGLCFVDYAASAPYVNINMHPENPAQKFDAIFFSPHKFLGGPGTSGVLVFDSKLYKNQIPDRPGGGTVDWTNPWGGHKYIESIEAREDGGTPGFLQSIRTALCIKLKDEMGVENILKREHEMSEVVFDRLEKLPNLHILASHVKKRLGIFSFYVEDVHYNLLVKILNDRYGIQVRGGCSCAGTYGHYLLNVQPNHSKSITDEIDHNDLSNKPGWVRMSIHPTMTNDELDFILTGIEDTVKNIEEWSKDYVYCSKVNEFSYKDCDEELSEKVKDWFNFN